MKKFLERFKNYRKDRGDAVLVTTLISIPLLCVCFAFATGISLATWQKTSYISSAQAAATASLQKVGSNGYLNRKTMESFVSEYLSQTGRKGALALESGSLAAGQGSAKGETGVFNSGKCDTAMVNGVERKIPFIEVELDINRTSGESNISTYAYTSEGPTGTLKNPTGGFGKVVDGQQYRVINAKVWEASTNVTWVPFFTPTTGDMTCQPYNVDVSAILFGNNEDLSQGEQCFQPDAFPVTPAETRQVASTPTALYTSPLGTCKTVLTSMSKGLPVLVTGTYREWSKVTTKMGNPSKAYEGWVLTASLTEPQDWTVEYDLGCDGGVCGTPTSELKTTYKSSPDPQPIPSLTKPGYNFIGWQRVKCVERDNIGSVENPGAIPAYMYGKLCYVGKFSVKTYLVAWDKNGGTSGGLAAQEYPAGAKVQVPPNAVKTGYDSLGWFSSPSTTSGATYAAPGSYVTVMDKNITFYQQYTKSANPITVDQNGGTGGKASSSSYFINETASQSFTLTRPTRAGYSFKSWSVTSGPGSVSGDTLTVPANNSGPVTVRANWNAIDYFVILDPNGGNGQAASPTNYNVKTSSQTVSLTAQRIGYNLSGWTITGNSSIPSTVSGNILTIPAGASGDIRVQAQWNRIQYPINLDKNGGSGGQNSFGYYMDQNVQIFVIDPPTRAGYSFNGWDIISGPASASSAYGVTIPGGSSGAVNLRASWAKVYPITFQANGGSYQDTLYYPVSSSAQNVTVTVPTRGGYTFDGWTVSGAGAFMANNTTLSIPANAAANILMTPKWKANTYNIYNLATGGIGQAANPFTYNTNSSSVTTSALTRPWRTGYTFDGWYLSGQTQGAQSYISGDTLYIPAGAYGPVYVGARWR